MGQLNTPSSLEALGIAVAERQQVNIDGLIQSTLPEEVRGYLRMEINGNLAKTLFNQGALSRSGEKSDTIIKLPFEETVLTGWRLLLVNEAPNVTICFLEGEGRIVKDTFDSRPVFVIHNGSTSFPIPVESVSSITSPDLYFKNPELIP